MDAVRGVEHGFHAQDRPFPLAIRLCPLTNEGSIVRKKLARVFPLCKVGQRAVEDEVSFLCLPVVAEILLYVLAIVA